MCGRLCSTTDLCSCAPMLHAAEVQMVPPPPPAQSFTQVSYTVTVVQPANQQGIQTTYRYVSGSKSLVRVVNCMDATLYTERRWMIETDAGKKSSFVQALMSDQKLQACTSSSCVSPEERWASHRRSCVCSASAGWLRLPGCCRESTVLLLQLTFRAKRGAAQPFWSCH